MGKDTYDYNSVLPRIDYVKSDNRLLYRIGDAIPVSFTRLGQYAVGGARNGDVNWPHNIPDPRYLHFKHPAEGFITREKANDAQQWTVLYARHRDA